MQLRADNLISSVVTRMRLGWFVLTALLASVVVASILGLKNVQETQRTLSERAIPTLEQFESVSDELVLFQANVDALVSADEANTHKEQAIKATASLERLDALFGRSGDFQGIVGALDTSLQELDRIGQFNLTNRADIDGLFIKLEALGLQLSEKVSRRIVDDGTSLETKILNGAVNGPQADQLIVTVSELNSLTQLGSAIAAVIEKVDTLLSSQSRTQLSELEERLAFEFRGAVRDLVLLRQGALRQELANAVGQMRALVLDERGLVALQKEQLEVALLRDQELQSIERLLGQTSATVNEGVVQAKVDIGEAASLIDATVARTISQLFVLGAAIMLAMSLATIYLIERQVIRRLGLLTKSVREIAAGNNEWDVKVNGPDEFGEMASALEIFKGNSKELRRSNEELGRFAYAASHDLRSPLRAIHDLAQWTIEDAGDALPEDCRKNLDMMMDRTSRLSDLLDSLLDYSRVGRETSKISNVDLRSLALDILDLSGASGRFTLKIVGKVETAKTYEAPFRQVLHNFITNAIKHHDRESGEITLDYRRVRDRLFVSITDDGPGIDPAYHEKVFELFKTLQSRDKVEGSGMGLAIIRKQVEQHGGKLSVHSDPEKERGTTFTFDWPLVEEQNVIEFAA